MMKMMILASRRNEMTRSEFRDSHGPELKLLTH